MDFDTAGTGVQGALLGGALERGEGKAGEAHHLCADCGTELVGRFCHGCGQPAHIHRTLLHLGEELLHGVMHFDGRIWRTLPLLFFRPGRLTREWVHGKRSRYVSPLAIFLFAIFAMFMLMSMMPEAPERTLGEVRTEKAAELISDSAKVIKLQKELEIAATPEAKAEAQADLSAAKIEVAKTRDELEGLDEAAKAGVPEGDWKEQVAERAKKGKWTVNTGSDKLNEKIQHKLENPELALYKLQQTFYKFSFLLVPLSIPFMALLFIWKRGFTLYDHGVFVLYSLTFMSVLVTISMAAIRLNIVPALAVTLAMTAVPIHMYFQLKGAYSLRRWSAFWRTVFLLHFCLIILILFFITILMLGFG